MKNKYWICEWYLVVHGSATIKMAGKLGYDGIQALYAEAAEEASDVGVAMTY